MKHVLNILEVRQGILNILRGNVSTSDSPSLSSSFFFSVTTARDRRLSISTPINYSNHSYQQTSPLHANKTRKIKCKEKLTIRLEKSPKCVEIETRSRLVSASWLQIIKFKFKNRKKKSYNYRNLKLRESKSFPETWFMGLWIINEIRFSDLRDEDRFGKKHSDHRQTEEINRDWR